MTPGQQGGAVPAGDLRPGLEHAVSVLEKHLRTELTSWTRSMLSNLVCEFRARLAEQPAPARTGEEERVEGLRKAAESGLNALEAVYPAISVASDAIPGMPGRKAAWAAALNELRAALAATATDGAPRDGEGRP